MKIYLKLKAVKIISLMSLRMGPNNESN
jgi:hypothetical protein